MKHILVLAFAYNRYKRDAVIKVLAGGNLVAELNLSESIKIKTVNLTNTSVHRRRIGPKNISEILILPEKLFLIEIEEKYIDKSIKIQVENDYNNYSNGFMTKYSWIMFHSITLLPDCLLHEKKWKRLYRFKNTGKESTSSRRYPPRFYEKYLILDPGKEQWPDGFLLCTRGGNFTVEIPLSRKYGFWHIGKVSPGRLYVNDELQEFLSSYNALNTSA
jgi:hypothetical protein